jgi:hypothetical protein
MLSSKEKVQSRRFHWVVAVWPEWATVWPGWATVWPEWAKVRRSAFGSHSGDGEMRFKRTALTGKPSSLKGAFQGGRERGKPIGAFGHADPENARKSQGRKPAHSADRHRERGHVSRCLAARVDDTRHFRLGNLAKKLERQMEILRGDPSEPLLSGSEHMAGAGDSGPERMREGDRDERTMPYYRPRGRSLAGFVQGPAPLSRQRPARPPEEPPDSFKRAGAAVPCPAPSVRPGT